MRGTYLYWHLGVTALTLNLLAHHATLYVSTCVPPALQVIYVCLGTYRLPMRKIRNEWELSRNFGFLWRQHTLRRLHEQNIGINTIGTRYYVTVVTYLHIYIYITFAAKRCCLIFRNATSVICVWHEFCSFRIDSMGHMEDTARRACIIQLKGSRLRSSCM